MRRVRQIWIGATLLATLAAGPACADEDLPVPAPRRSDSLRIPGLPPIQPPDAGAFGPHGPRGPGVDDEDGSDLPGPRTVETPHAVPQAARPNPDRLRPHSTPSEETLRAGLLNRLFGQLKTTADPDDAKGVAMTIERVWLRSGSDTADLLMGRAMTAMAAKDLKTAETLLDAVVAIEPNWAEAWNKRATVRFLRDDDIGATADIEQTLKLEPRHFGALEGLGAILQKSALDKRALEAYRRALEIYPEQPDVRKIVDKLQIEVEGRDI